MSRNSFVGLLLAVAATFAAAGAMAQTDDWTQDKSCPGWNNPANFNSGNAVPSAAVPGVGYYSGQGGNLGGGSQKQCPNVLTGETGINWTTTYTAAQMDAGVGSSCSATSYSNSSLPQRERQFRINSGTGTDPNTDNHLKLVPSQFNTFDTGGVINTNITKSIRIGDACANGSSWSGDQGGAALYYNMRVTSQNAMLYLYYAIVAEAPTHGMRGNPTFIIRVMRQNGSNWQQISDTLAYYITTTPSTNTSNPCPGMQALTPNASYTANLNGSWYKAQGNNVYFKDWAKVAINLSNYIYENLRIEVRIYDCEANYHYAYAYVAGECRPMLLQVSGCPAGRSTNVATITAPRGMMNYEWRVSRFGVSDPITDYTSPTGANRHFSFRTVASGTEAQGMHVYQVQADDFRITRRTRTAGGHDSVTVDSVGMNQTFECRMTSALDPAKPFTSSLYVNVDNTKPTMKVDSLSYCDGSVHMRNLSFVPGNPSLVVDSATTWSFYNNAVGGGTPAMVVTGDTAVHVYDDAGLKSVVARTYTTDPACWSEAIYTIKPRISPQAVMTVSRHVLCDADETTLSDATEGGVWRRWTFLSNELGPDGEPALETVEGYYNDNKSITRGFNHNIEPIELLARNGQYYLNPANIMDTVWCQNIARDTVAVFVHPEVEVTGDTVVCVGSLTDANVRAVGVDNCTYQWSRTLGTVTGGLPSGSHLAVTPYADTSVYYVRVTTQEGCVAWDSAHAYLVRPQLSMLPTDGRICPGDEAILTGSAADHYTWSASPADPSLVGQDSADVIHVRPSQTTTYTMIGHGTNNCDASPLTKTVTIVPLPVPRIVTEPDFVDADYPTITLRDVSTGGINREWLFHDGETATTRDVQHTFDEAIGHDSVYVKLTSYNALDCPKDKTFGINVKIYTAWFPNIFTPGSEDENAKFRLYTLTEYEFFHIYIYNRGGQLVYESVDPMFEWDGTSQDGPCPQGTYVYVCNYRKNGTTTLMTKSGSVTLVR